MNEMSAIGIPADISADIPVYISADISAEISAEIPAVEAYADSPSSYDMFSIATESRSKIDFSQKNSHLRAYFARSA